MRKICLLVIIAGLLMSSPAFAADTIKIGEIATITGDFAAFGDAEVDICMFNIAKTSICVGSGREEAKKEATYVTDDVKDDGIYNALKHFNLIG